MHHLTKFCSFPEFSKLMIAFILTSFSFDTFAEKANKQSAENNTLTEFDSSFLGVNESGAIDLTRFSQGASAIVGVYKTSIYLNETLLSNNDIDFKKNANGIVSPCLNSELIKKINIDFSKADGSLSDSTDSTGCIDLKGLLSGTRVNYDSNEQRLDISIPQIYMQHLARGSVNPELWDSGVTSLFLGYNLNGYSSDANDSSVSSLFAGINSGLNFGAWYLRHNGAYSQTNSNQKTYDNINSYMQRDIPALNARVIIGQANTTGEIFNTLPFTGAQLATDERMLPESLRGYAPVIRGYASTNARVVVRQGGQIIYETTVAPGPFQINDLYPTGYGGDIIVNVLENNGRDSSFLVPYAALTQLLRPGSSRYALTTGAVRSEYLSSKPEFLQATYQRGLTNRISVYGGAQISNDYHAILLGAGVGTDIGAFSLDITQSKTTIGSSRAIKNAQLEGDNDEIKDSYQGQSYQLSYSKLIEATRSNVSLAAYRFSTDGYMDFMTALQRRNAVKNGYSINSIYRAKNKMTVTVNQDLPAGWGQVYLSGSHQDYWNKQNTDKQFQYGYNNSQGLIAYGLTVSRTFSNVGNAQTNYMLSLSIPLGSNDEIYTPILRTDLGHSTNGSTGQQVSLSGTGGDNHQFSYGISALNENKGVGSSGSANINYRTNLTAMNGSLSVGRDVKSVSGGLNGTLVAHSGGITASPYNAETMALIEAPGAQGATLTSYPSLAIDANGYALVPYLNPYQMNEIHIDPTHISYDIEFDSTLKKVAPYSGAVVKVKYNTKTGIPVVIDSLFNQKALPFGADVYDFKGNAIGSVGQGSQIYARVAEEKGTLLVKWGESSDVQCRVSYKILPLAKETITRTLQKFRTPCLN